MKKIQTKQPNKLDRQSPISDVQVIDGILYLTVDLGKKGKQRWKNNGNRSFFVAYL